MKKKLFIGIDMPAEVKKTLMRKIKNWADWPVIWTLEENFHLTLYFIGYVYEDKIPEICANLQEVLSDQDIFDIEFDQIILAPDETNPKTIWLSGPKSEELKNLQEKVEKAMGTFHSPKKAFRPHVTLGRIRRRLWKEQKIDPGFPEKTKIIVSVTSVTVFESQVINGKRAYIPLDVYDLLG